MAAFNRLFGLLVLGAAEPAGAFQQYVTPFLTVYGYPAVFLILVFCGVGLPVPEEATFIFAGYLVKKSGLDVWIMIAVSLGGILAGDSITYFLGHRYGYRLLARWPFRKLISPDGLERSRKFFAKHGSWTIFIFGCMAGVRAPTFFLSGTMGVTYGRFLRWDLARALVTCPISIFAGYWFGEDAEEWLAEYKYEFFAALGVLVLGLLIHHWWVRRRRGKDQGQPPKG